MTITTKEAKELRTRITKLVTAARADEFKGAGDPQDRAQIEEDLRRAEQKLHEYIELLKLPDGRIRS